ncbi:MAG: ABC transporter substrate binding component [Candidatus Scalindua rubra]|uniref:ABC transporter substrate binding component n=1 Tax=Candidatus Scalindua rubra TaxID=1872076 RepID=A0A1E3XAG0_9BACT|nr:MAG: ABC transporter substrate binding component [Candidatus Scalindua rubra]
MIKKTSSKSWVIILLIIVFVFIGLFYGCQRTTKERLERTIVWGGPKNISMIPIIADKKGFFKRAGLNVQTNYIQTGKIAMDALMSKDIDFSVSVETNMAFIKYQPESNLQVICSIAQKYDDAIVARRDMGINSPKDLEGNTVALLAATTSHVFADRFFKFYGLDPNKINIFNLTPPSIQAAVITGNVTAGSIWQPYRYNVVKELGDKAIEFNDRRIYKAYSIVAVRKEFALQHPELIKKFLRVLIEAEEHINSYKEVSIAILSKELGIEPEVLRAVWEEYVNKVELDNDLFEIIKEEGVWIHETQKGFKEKPVPEYTDVINAQFLQEVDPARVHLGI